MGEDGGSYTFGSFPIIHQLLLPTQGQAAVWHLSLLLSPQMGPLNQKAVTLLLLLAPRHFTIP